VKAFEAGITHVHAAFDYYNLKCVGAGLRRRPRAEIFVTAMTAPCIHTAANPKRNVSDPRACYDLTLQEMGDTLAQLGVDYADLFLLHGPSESFGYEGACDNTVCAINRAQWRAYQDFMHAGKTTAIGVSNYCQSCLLCLQETVDFIAPAVNQIQWHVGMGGDPEGLPSFCKEQQIVVQAYGPLASGAVATDALCTSVGLQYNKSAAQVGLRWILQHQSEVSTAIVAKADDPAYLAEDLDIFDWTLSDVDMGKLSEATVPKGQQDGRPSWGCAK
jgi:diketogulonate reductase-like aldo/keto reductase